MHAAIKVDKISKLYYIGLKQHKKPSLREAISEAVLSPWNRFKDLALRGSERVSRHLDSFWAVRDVSFEAYPGEIIGLVGRNGAGKSTLLKVLSRITAPTKGKFEIRGTMSSLLEVGTGFHPHLTGRENVYLSGSILGMKQADIRHHFDEIVSFAEVERFIDTPIKYYSTGMYVRLAFAVSAFLNPDILLVDEVLAVGDGAFRKKCLGKLGSDRTGSRTVIFVSHNLQMVRGLCSRILHIDNGEIVSDLPVDLGITAYNRFLRQPRDISNDGKAYRANNATGAALFTNFVALGSEGDERWRFKQGETVTLHFSYKVVRNIASLGVRIIIRSTISGETITSSFQLLSESSISAGRASSFSVEFPDICLRPGDYALSFLLTDKNQDKVFDLLDEHVDVPWLSVDVEKPTLQPDEGYVTLPSRLSSKSRMISA